MAVTISNIDPIFLENQTYSFQDLGLIPVEVTNSIFDPTKNYIEYTIIANNGTFEITNQNFTNYKIINDPSPSNTSIVYSVDLNPEQDLRDQGFVEGEYNTIYRFLRNELSSSAETRPYYIKEISSDRTEIRLVSNTITNSDIELLAFEFKSRLSSTPYFQDFYLNFGGNNLIIANNILVDNTKTQYEILINLYEPLPSQYSLKETLWVVTQVANPLAFNVQFEPEVIVPIVTNPTLKGPNTDLSVKDRINNSSDYINFEELLSTSLITSYNQVVSYLNDSGINISIDYTDFSNFVHFSSARTRVENFYYKVQLIEEYNRTITTAALSVSSSFTTSSIELAEAKKTEIIKNFDGYEYYLYFSSESKSYPKTNTDPPYDLYYSGDNVTISWLDSLLAEADLYDENNQDYLANTIPDYLREDPQNDPYKIFVDMIGQFYDNIWVYYKDVSNRYNGDNRLDYGISKDLVADALRSFGLKIYQNNFSAKDLFNAITGLNIIPYGPPVEYQINGNVYVENDVSTGPPQNGPIYINEDRYTGYFIDDVNYYYYGDPAEKLTSYITASQEALFKPTDDINKEVYKRLYHNLPLLLKQKGTVAGLRNLINIYGIPDSILRISEFGGRDRKTSTYDYLQNRYSHAFKTYNNSLVRVPWSPLQRNSNLVPNCVQFRFKADGKPTSTDPQILLLKSDFSLTGSINITAASTSSLFLISLQQSGSGTDSYSGSVDPYENYGKLKFWLWGTGSQGYFATTQDIYLPFFDGGWWNIMLQKSGRSSRDNADNVYTLYAANKIYDSEEGYKIGHIASSSVIVNGVSSSVNSSWNSAPTFTDTPTALLGGRYSKFTISDPRNPRLLPPLLTTNNKPIFSGSFQEFRYYSYPLSESQFRDYTMNPESIEGLGLTGVTSSFGTLRFRAPLGNELEIFTSSLTTFHSQSFTSVHPAVTASANSLITQSFTTVSSIFSNNSSYLIYYSSSAQTRSYYEPNIETYYYNQPLIGLKNRNTNKIQLVEAEYPSISVDYTQPGNILSPYISIAQNWAISGSEIPDVNALEVAFSPQNEVDDDIISTLGYFDIGEYIGDPRQVSSSNTFYPDLNRLRDDYFKKYYDSYGLFDYIRLIKYFDNSLFKLIKDFVPARTNLRSGIVVKQHLLERNKYPQPQASWEDVTLSGSVYSQQKWDPVSQSLYMSSSLIEKVYGSTGGTFNEFNTTFSEGSIIANDGNALNNYSTYKNVFNNAFNVIPYGNLVQNSYFDINGQKEIISNYNNNDVTFKFYINLVGTFTTYTFKFSSSLQGEIATFSTTASTTNTPYYYDINNVDISPNETFVLLLSASALLSGVSSASLSATFPPTTTQVWYETTIGPTGSTQLLHNDQSEFYNGELQGTIIEASNGELNEANEFKYASTLEIPYDIYLYRSNIISATTIASPPNTLGSGSIYLYYDINA
jgi:hypothetical protein